MMTNKMRIGDPSLGHGCFPPTTVYTGSTTVFTDQIPQARMTDQYVPHCCPPAGCHPVVIRQGSPSAFADQLAIHCVRHMTACGDMAAAGSITSFAAT